MALTKCTECNTEVSDKATSCPKCGAPMGKTEHEQQKKTTSPWRILSILAGLVVVAIVIMMIVNNPNSVPGIKVEINTPNPIVATQRADDANSTLLKEKTTVYTTIQNQGGAGSVLVTFHLTQAGNDYTRSKSISMQTNESVDLSETFSEVTRLGGEIKYSVEAKAE